MAAELSRSISIEGLLYLLDVDICEVVKVAGVVELDGLFHRYRELSPIGQPE